MADVFIKIHRTGFPQQSVFHHFIRSGYHHRMPYCATMVPNSSRAQLE
jgi:hypothetical protein